MLAVLLILSLFGESGLLGELGGTAVECRAESKSGTECRRFDAKFLKLKKKLNALAVRDDLAIPPDWMDLGKRRWSTRFYRGDEAWHLVFDTRERVLSAEPDGWCLDKSRLDDLGVVYFPAPGPGAPKRLVHVGPDYPEEARIDPTNGRVSYEVVVSAKGAVLDACAVGSIRQNYGFEDAGLEALRQWRYEPATVDGEPVASLLLVHIDWTIGLN